LRDFERATEDGGRFVLDKEERAVRFSLGDFLEDAKEGDGCEEEAGREGCQGRLWKGGGRIAKLVDFWPRRWW